MTLKLRSLLRPGRVAAACGLLIATGLYVQQGCARPQYLDRYRAFPFARPELKTCAICHVSPSGGGPRNEFGQAFARTSHQFTPELRAQFPDRFLQDRAILPGGVEIVFDGGEPGAIIIRKGGESYKVMAAKKEVEKLADSAAVGAGAQTAAAEQVSPSPVFDYQYVNVRTGKVVQKHEFNFRFAHRFSSPVFNQSRRPFDMFGFDTFSYTGIGVGYGITDRIAINVYRQVWDRKLEFSGDFSLLEQGKNHSPISFMARAAVDGQKDFAGEGHRGHYTPSLQLVVSRNFADRFALSLDPTFVFRTRNLGGGENEVDRLVALGIGASVKLRENIALVGEVVPRLTTNPLKDDFYHREPTSSFGFQFRTSRHVFEFVFSNSWETNIAGTALGGPDGKHLGFNIYRRIK